MKSSERHGWSLHLPSVESVRSNGSTITEGKRYRRQSGLDFVSTVQIPVIADDKAAHEYYVLVAIQEDCVYGEFVHLHYAEVREGLRLSLNKNK